MSQEIVIVTEPKRHEQVNAFTEEEQTRIQNEVSKTEEPEEFCPSPAQLRQVVTNAIEAMRKAVTCLHARPRYVGAISWCSMCGAIKQPLPTPNGGSSGIPIGDGDWEVPMLLRTL
jgi:hypothetical protein